MAATEASGPLTEADLGRIRDLPTAYGNESWGKPVADNYMYDFKYNFPLPVHKDSNDFADFTNQESDQVDSIATQFLQELAYRIRSGDAAGFASLFLDIGTWKDKVVFTWNYRSFNTPTKINEAASHLLPATATRNFRLSSPKPAIQRPYHDIAWLQVSFTFDTDIAGASGLMNLIKTRDGQYKIWTLQTAIESLHDYPELPNRDGHMRGDRSWHDQRVTDDNLENVEPDVVIVGGGHCGLNIASRLKALGVNALIVERNKRIGDNWRNRYEYLSLHFPHWGDHFPYFPFPDHWPTYTPAGKMGDWLEWYASAMELTAWTDSSVTAAKREELPEGGGSKWTLTVKRGGEDGYTRTFHPKHVVIATSLAGVPFVPKIPGMDQFKGTVRHSTVHDSSRGWEGKKVLVVGTSSSGFDTAYDFARRGIDVTLLQRSPTYLMTLDNSVPRMIAPLYEPKNGKRPDIDETDRVHFSGAMGPSEELSRRMTREIWNDDVEMLARMEKAGFKVWRGQRDTGVATLGHTKNGGFYYEAGACQAVIDGKIRVRQGQPLRFTEDGVVLGRGGAGGQEEEHKYDLVILATGFSNTIDSVRAILGNDVATLCKPIWGIDEEGETRSAWAADCGIDNLWLMVGTFHQARYHSKKVALRILADLKGISRKPYTK